MFGLATRSPCGLSYPAEAHGQASQAIRIFGRLCTVADLPETKYVRAGDGTKLAYQVIGDGPIDLVVLNGTSVPVDLMWDDPGLVRINRRLVSFSRTIWFEGRGQGSSEGEQTEFSVGEVSDGDLMALLEAVGSESTVILGTGFAGSSAIHFSVTHPEQVSALILVDVAAHYVREEDYPWGFPPPVLERFLISAKENWGSGVELEWTAPTRFADDRFRTWYSRCQRLSLGPDDTAQWLRSLCHIDVRRLLPSVRAPTLVLHREGDRLIQLGAGKYVAEHIPGAKMVVLPGEDHLFFVGDTDALVDEVEDFLTGRHQAPEGDLVLTTVLFTDIVNSTEQSAALGPRTWSKLTDEHDALVRATLQRHGGREVKTMGDGFLATFDGGVARAVRCASEITAGTAALGLGVRAGMHTGEVEVRANDIAGLAVTIAKRICDLAGPGQVLVSETVRELLVGSGIPLSAQGIHVLKGVPDEWRLFAVQG